jgi:hypothetical protein
VLCLEIEQPRAAPSDPARRGYTPPLVRL